ncbi:MAG: coproporphyrinogen oxidase [Cyanobacteria bacterium RYN_339]|nr:coproporphyrinogen oxidase [Cyanobacteria bacterium RYN_339]
MIRLPDHDALFPAIGLYVHFPFCAKKCSYCDFPSFAGQDDQMDAYLGALEREIAAAPRRHVRTVFLGGGTPSYVPGPWMERIMAAIHARFDLLPGAEVTMEANPGNERLHQNEEWRRYRAMGITRISMGVQSFDPAILQALGRIHSPGEALETVAAVQAAGFDSASIDLMYGLPGQSVETWRSTLQQAVALGLPHLSAYSLIVEPHTPFDALERQGKLKLPSEDQERGMAAVAEEVLGSAGYAQYEISNWAQPGFESRHNTVYWLNEPWLGLGSGSHSYYQRRRWANATTIKAYIEGGPTPMPEAPQDLTAELEETMFMGLRLTREGVTDARFRQRFGVGLLDVYGDRITKLGDLVTWENERLTLSKGGLPLGNEVFEEFLEPNLGPSTAPASA